MSDKDKNDFGHKTEGRARAAMSGILWAGLTSLTPTVASALVFLVTSRVLMPADFGLVAFIAALVAMIALFSPTGFGEAVVQYADIGDRHLNTVFWLCAGAGAVLYALVLLATPMLVWFYDNPQISALMPVLGLRVILDQLALVPKSLLSRGMAFRKLAIRSLWASTVAAAVCLMVLWAGYGLWALVASQLVVSLVNCIVTWASVSWRPRWTFDRTALRDLSRFGLYSSGSQFVTALNVEQLMVGALLGPAALGLIGFARRLFQMLTEVMTGALGAVSYPLLASLQKEPEKLREAYLTTTFLSSILAFPCFIGLALVADEFVPILFGEQWLGAVTALRAFCMIGILTCIGVLQFSLVRSRGRADWWMWYQIVQQVLTAGVILGTWQWGVSAVAVGIAIKTWLVWPVTTFFAARLIDLRVSTYLRQFLAPALAALVMAGVVFAIRQGMTPGGLSLICQILGGAVGYAICIVILARRRLGQLRALLRRRKSKETP